MRRAVAPLIALVVIQPALAGELVITKTGMLRAYAWLDGEPQGKVTSIEPLERSLEDGSHEVFIARERSGLVAACRGVVQIGKDEAEIRVEDHGCSGIVGVDSIAKADEPQEGPPGTALRGGWIVVEGDIDRYWLVVDGGQPWTWPHSPVRLNVFPGDHQLEVREQQEGGLALCRGEVSVAAGQTAVVRVSPIGCEGLRVDQVPVELE